MFAASVCYLYHPKENTHSSFHWGGGKGPHFLWPGALTFEPDAEEPVLSLQHWWLRKHFSEVSFLVYFTVLFCFSLGSCFLSSRILDTGRWGREAETGSVAPSVHPVLQVFSQHRLMKTSYSPKCQNLPQTHIPTAQRRPASALLRGGQKTGGLSLVRARPQTPYFPPFSWLC